MQEKDFNKIEVKKIYALTLLVMKIVFPIYVSDQKFEDSMDLLFLNDDDKLHDVCIKYFDRFVSQNKKWFCRSCLQCFSSESVLIKHKEDCLSINGKQSVKLEKGIIEFENYFKQIPVPFKIYADFECNLRGVESYEGSYTKKYQDHIPCSFACNVVCVDEGLLSQLLMIEVKMQLTNLLKQFLRSISTAEK